MIVAAAQRVEHAIGDSPVRRRLRPLRHDQQFWFAVAAFLPDVRILR